VDDSTFGRLFWTSDVPRDNFRSRLFGLFSEEIVRYWSENERAPYRNLGRPTLWSGGEFATIDFTLQSRADGRRYVAEQKSELAFEAHRYLRLQEPAQLTHHAGRRAFDWFLDMGRDPTSHEVRIGGRPANVAGAILIWGAVDPRGRSSATEAFGFADVLSLESMVEDLAAWGDQRWQARLRELRAWSDELFDGLT